jgi:hypothetical protein
LVETPRFQGRTAESVEAWKKVQDVLKKNPTTFYGGPFPEPAPGTEFDDLNPPPTFLVSLDGPIDGYTTDGAGFFGSGGIDRPIGLGAVQCAMEERRHSASCAFGAMGRTRDLMAQLLPSQ